MRITKVTTKTGDKGKTKLSDGSSISKSDIRIKAIGSIDELKEIIESAEGGVYIEGVYPDGLIAYYALRL